MEHNKRYRMIANKLLRTLPEFEDLKNSDVKIAYLSSDEPKKKDRRLIFAECCRVDDKYKWCCNYDFFIVVYEPNISWFTEEQINILIRHELHHVGIDYSGSEVKYYIVPHDVEEFWEIINEHGLKWSEENAKRDQPKQ